MIALVMAGGKGTRMNFTKEKLLLEYEKPIVLRVIDALKNSERFSKILVATSKNSPKTKEMLQELDVQVIDTSGTGYTEDLNSVLQSLSDQVLVVSGDLALLDYSVIRKIVEKKTDATWMSFLVTKDFLESLGLSSEYITKFDGKECIYTGISFVDAEKISDFESVEENFLIINDKKIAFNLNTQEDYNLLQKS